jgi:hypothetical protein
MKRIPITRTKKEQGKRRELREVLVEMGENDDGELVEKEDVGVEEEEVEVERVGEEVEEEEEEEVVVALKGFGLQMYVPGYCCMLLFTLFIALFYVKKGNKIK